MPTTYHITRDALSSRTVIARGADIHALARQAEQLAEQTGQPHSLWRRRTWIASYMRPRSRA